MIHLMRGYVDIGLGPIQRSRIKGRKNWEVGKFSIYTTVASMSLNENLAGEMLIELKLKTLETSKEY